MNPNKERIQNLIAECKTKQNIYIRNQTPYSMGIYNHCCDTIKSLEQILRLWDREVG